MVCKNCGSEFEEKKRGRKNSGFCSSKCREQWREKTQPKRYTKTCDYCGEEYQTNRQNQKYCSQDCSRKARKTGRTVYTKTCLYCRKEFQTTHKNYKYCTSTCASRHAGDLRRGEYFCEYCGKPRFSDHPNRNRFCSRACANKARRLETLDRHKKRKKQHEIEMTRECQYCGSFFVANSRIQKYCSSNCQYQHSLRVSHEKNVEKFTPKIRLCLYCGKPFGTRLQAQDKKYCSESCREKSASKAYKERRKEQMKKAFVESVSLSSVYRKYEGRCGICGLTVPDTTEPSNQWAATIDHRVPISKGGLHEISNCQLAHRLCNSLKADVEATFQIDWGQKLKLEPGRWNEQLDDLWRQIDAENIRIG